MGHRAERLIRLVLLALVCGQAACSSLRPCALHCPSNCPGGTPLAPESALPSVQTLEELPRSYFAGFINPGASTAKPQLTLLEPYQAGKVPVVLIHGLFSDARSWADMVNDLRAAPGFGERFQLWVFSYPTGQGFLQSAAALRTQLRAAVLNLDPQQSDPALAKIVLVGHSMGGLVARYYV